MPLQWIALDPDLAHVAEAPLFGRIRVERWSDTDQWRVNWSAPGWCEQLMPGRWPDAADAMREADKHVAAALQRFAAQPPIP